MARSGATAPLRGCWLLARPHNLAIAFPAIFLGGFVAGSVQPIVKLLLACFSGVCIGAGGNAINDYYDIGIDRINRPNRPLPSGLVTPGQARGFAFTCFGAGTALSACIHLPCFLVALGASVLLVQYSRLLKRTVLLGNLTVAFMLGLALVYGGMAVGRIRNAAVVGVFSFLYNMAREILKDIEDMDGDRANGAVTFPIRYGIRASLVLTTAVLVSLIAATIVPYALGYFSRTYLWIVVLGVDLYAAYAILSMWRKPDPKHLGKLAVGMKLDMLAGLLAVFLGRTQ
jgi:geranylgeranylglycerol-phosphate geranylgeranyltransferase